MNRGTLPDLSFIGSSKRPSMKKSGNLEKHKGAYPKDLR
jgi:hypothetical protein